MGRLPRTNVEELQDKLPARIFSLVCAYRSKEECQRTRGGLSYTELESRLPGLPEDEEICLLLNLTG